MGRARRWGGMGLACALLVGLAGAATPAAAAAPSLADVLLVSPGPGFVAEAPGPANGPVTASNVDQPGLGSASGLLGQHIGDGTLTAYVRTWRDPATGAGIDVVATRFADSSLIPAYLDDVAGLQHGTPFQVAGGTAAWGAATFGTVDGVGVADYVVTFTVRATVFVLTVVTRGNLDAYDAVALAQTQAVAATTGPGAAATMAPSSVGPSFPTSAVALGAVVLALLVATAFGARALARRRHRAHTTTRTVAEPARAPATATAPPAEPAKGRRIRRGGAPPAVPTRRPDERGWVYLDRDLNVQCYWDGSRWTGRKEWSVADHRWIETSPGPAPAQVPAGV